MIFFSVIIPVYNRAGLIADTLDTILAQTYPHFEIVIVDDGSIDKTGEVIKQKYAHDNRVRYFYKENEERGAGRNFGMKQAKGDWAVIFDSDDWMHADHLAVLEKEIVTKKETGINFIATKYQLKDDEEKIITGFSSSLSEGWYGLDEMLKGSQFGCLYAINLHNKDLHSFPPERKYSTHEDWMFLLKNLQHDRIYLVDKVTITVRHHNNRSMSMNQRVIKARMDAVEWGQQNLVLSPEQRKTFLSYSDFFCGIHEYLDGNSGKAINLAMAAIKTGGLKQEFVKLLIKSVVGRSIINRLKKTFH